MADIAVIGMSCRFPGDATSPEKLWKMLKARKTAWSKFPEDRMNMKGFYHPDGHRQGSISFRGAHFLRDDIASFDASFFYMNEDDVSAMDPQQRLLLETSYEAIENSGLLVEDLKGSDTSVYVGSFVRDYEQVSLRDMDYQPQYAATGTGTAIMSNRISYFYDLRGESITLDTGCSGSLVAVHHACQSLLSGASSIALAAGAGIILTPNTMMPMTALNFLSPDGKCFTFDYRANGYGRGEGVGFVVLKRLSDALKDNDPIRAVIKGTHVNQDGRTPGITLPSKVAQVDNIRSVYNKAGLDFCKTAYVECHGTGTKAGDLTELTAVAETIASGRHSGEALLVGSVKPNVGHLEGAAGIAGLIKGVLVVEKGEIPPNANFKMGNREIDFDAWGLKVPTQPLSWPTSGLRRVSVNCFGFGGTNAHAVVDEGAYYVEQYRASKMVRASPVTAKENESDTLHLNGDHDQMKEQLLVLSAPDQQGALRVVKALAEHFRSSSSNLSQGDLDNLAYTLGCRRSKFEWKAHVVANSRAEVLEQLALIERQRGLTRSRTNTNTNGHVLCKVSFVFCGQGAQWATMGGDLMGFPVYRESIHAAEAYLRDRLGFQLNLVVEMAKGASASRISQPQISQPATTALQVALVDLLGAFGIKPRSVVGHSSGEIAAAYASGMIDRETAWAVAYYRGLCATAAKVGSASRVEGSMCVLAMSEDQAREYLARTDKQSTVQIACLNSPRCVTLSGDRDDVQWIVRHARSEGFLARELPVEVAYHSSHMLSVAPEYLASLQDVVGLARDTDGEVEVDTGTCTPTAEMFSTVTGGRLLPHELRSPRYWADNLVSPVMFSRAVRTMISETRPDVVLDISPHGTLKGPFEEIVDAMSAKPSPLYRSVMDRKGNAVYTILGACGHLWTRGYPLNMQAVVRKGSSHGLLETLTDLPSYPWDHGKRFWHESPLTVEYRFRNFGRRDLIGSPTPDSMPQEPRWRGFLRVSENPWLGDHQVQKTIVYPAAGMISMVIEGSRQRVARDATPSGFVITNVRIENPMVIPETSYGLEVCLNMKQGSQEVLHGISFDWTIYGRTLNGKWTRHAYGCVEVRLCSSSCPTEATATPCCGEAFEKARSNSTKAVDPKHLYDMLDIVGMNYGPTFRNIKSVSKGDKQCVGTVVIPDTKSGMPCQFEFDHILHPATLDAVFQMLFAIDETPMVPTSLSSLFVSADVAQGAGKELFGYASAARSGLRGAEADIAMTTVDWDRPSIIVEGLRMTALPTTDYIPSHHNLCTEIQWKEDVCSASVGQDQFEELLCLLAHKYPGLSILQRGGDHHLAKHILDHVSSPDGYAPRLLRYSLSDTTSPQTLDHLQKAFLGSPTRHFLEERTLRYDTDLDPEYHLIISCENKGDDEYLEKLLLPDGLLLSRRDSEGFTGGDTGRACSSWDAGSGCFTMTYKIDIHVTATTTTTMGFNAQRVTRTHAPHRTRAILIIMPDHPNEEVDKLGQALSCLLSNDHHIQVEIVHLENLCALRCAQASRKVVVSLLDLGPAQSFVWNWTHEHFTLFRNVYKAAEAVLWVTRGANRRPTIPCNSPVIGLARTLVSEDPETVVTTLDLDEATQISEAGRSIFSVLDRSIISPPLVGPRESEYAEDHGRIFIPRLVPLKELNDLVEDTFSSTPSSMHPFLDGETKELLVLPPNEHREECGNFEYRYGTVDGDLSPYEIEMSFGGSILHHDDWQTITGHSRKTTIGMDLMGTITRVGANVKGIYPNDEVVGLAQQGSLKSQHRVDHRFVKKIPGGLRMCVPSAWISAYYSLCMRCYLRKGQRVLILCGASIYGQAALQIAQLKGAEVFSTISGPNSNAQWQLLGDAFGLDDRHVENCDDPDWHTKLLSKSGGQWMDIVYAPTLDCLDGTDRVVKTTGTLIYMENHSDARPCAAFSRLSMLRLDLAALLAEDPDLIAEIFNRVEDMHLKKRHAIKPSQLVDTFCLSGLSDAFRCLQTPASAVFVTAGPDTTVALPRRRQLKPLRDSIDSGTYVLAGGLGGLGRSIAQLLVDNGARNLVFLSRSATKSDDANTFLTSLEKQGVTAKHFPVDISDTAALRGVYEKDILLDMPPVSGVVQCAAVLQDALFDNMQYESWQKVVAPKGEGTRNLVNTFGRNRSNSDNNSDSGSDSGPFFIFLSSSAGIIGNRGQANYSAGNVFMDSLARSGTIAGRAISLDIGPVLEAGMVADDDATMQKLRDSGFYGIRHQDFLKIIERAIAGEIYDGVPLPAQVVLGIGTGGLIRQNRPADPYWSRTAAYAYLNLVDMPPPDLTVVGSDASTAGTGAATLKARLASCSSPAEASDLICQALKRELAARLSTVKAEDIYEGSCPKEYGIDSLMAVRIRVWALDEVGASISVFNILGDNTILELASRMADQVLAE
ncbi:phenolpthiocerol synthesis polyketide synthase ppsA [Sodiomyces alkalinus F11]|uniref:Phenolpthiocerol synthesis polyketide synthase ppsA n=1 Tax=Sodiomyces alkalinus (strain CBS 110278 / VKM F-3762 / F11) TaxID=1314773 RepID=A0A3N2PK44_SODAK|nr:phenolpthiocerol synthesis polyketide synthase ppsA [Sodiomyces alkalinus F11]ROT34686.1 phenolpthiocerol synthesis polyketide synthase ppsA [Sodiomyces alkalinus F11]